MFPIDPVRVPSLLCESLHHRQKENAWFLSLIELTSKLNSSNLALGGELTEAYAKISALEKSTITLDQASQIKLEAEMARAKSEDLEKALRAEKGAGVSRARKSQEEIEWLRNEIEELKKDSKDAREAAEAEALKASEHQKKIEELRGEVSNLLKSLSSESELLKAQEQISTLKASLEEEKVRAGSAVESYKQSAEFDRDSKVAALSSVMGAVEGFYDEVLKLVPEFPFRQVSLTREFLDYKERREALRAQAEAVRARNQDEEAEESEEDEEGEEEEEKDGEGGTATSQRSIGGESSEPVSTPPPADGASK